MCNHIWSVGFEVIRNSNSMWRGAWNNLDMERSQTFREGLPKGQVSWRSGLEWIWTKLVFTWEIMAFSIWNNWLVCCGNGYWLSNWRIPVFLSLLWLLHFITKPVFYFLKSFIFHFLLLPGLHGIWDLSSLIRVWTPAPPVEVSSPNHWTAMEFP